MERPIFGAAPNKLAGGLAKGLRDWPGISTVESDLRPPTIFLFTRGYSICSNRILPRSCSYKGLTI